MAMLLVKSLYVLACFAARFAFGAEAAPPTISETGVISYLEQYGYLSPRPPNVASARTKQGLAKAISDLQSFMGLNVTGTADEETIRLIKSPRCGVKDIVESSTGGRSKRYAFIGGPWRQQTVTYRITKYSDKLPRDVVDQVIARALALWAQYVPRQFERVSGQAEMEIRFERGYHGDQNPFRGPGNYLAHAFAPGIGIGGDVHFDEDEAWTVGQSDFGIDLFQVAVHEIGHALGLAHSGVRRSIMYPTYQPNVAVGFDRDDIAGIEALYGRIDAPHKGPVLRPTRQNRPFPRPGRRFP